MAYRAGRSAPRRRAVLALLAVLACHLVLIALLNTSLPPPARPRPAATRVTLRLIAPVVPRVAAAPAAMPAPPSGDRRPRVVTPGPITKQAIAPVPDDAPASTVLATPSPATSASAWPDPAASEPLRPLDLRLPRGLATRPNAHSPALDDARANSARLTPAQRMAQALDTTVIEDEMDNGRRRFRQGNNCVIVKPARIGQLMAFDDAAARSPSLVSACP